MAFIFTFVKFYVKGRFCCQRHAPGKDKPEIQLVDLESLILL